MSTVIRWIRSLGPSGAVANAGRACDERRQVLASVEERLQSLAPAAVIHDSAEATRVA